MPRSAELAALLTRLDGQNYKAYRDIEGAWQFAEFELFVDRVQSDPFASPSKLRVRLDLERARIAEDSFALDVQARPTRRIATAAWFARAFRDAIRAVSPPRTGTGKGGLMTIDAGGPEVLERTAVVLAEPSQDAESGRGFIEARIEVGLPAAGRRALGRDAAQLLIEALPRIVARTFLERDARQDAALRQFVDCVENQQSVRAQLAERGLIAFVGDGAILPRESGASEAPMPAEQALPFESPEAFRVEFEVPHAHAGAPGRRWLGMGIPRGVVLIVGGGYHGKSTLLRALERAVVPHVPGDGRETVVADPALVKVRAEDGRAVAGVDIQAFIDRLPQRPGEDAPRNTRTFSTPDASGSTSQAAQIAEAIEAGASGLLLDEDTSATNLMLRDARMQALIHPRDEPITPFLDRVRALYEDLGLSSVLVMGSSGDYFRVADAVLELRAYRTIDATARAHAIAAAASGTAAGAGADFAAEPRSDVPPQDTARPAQVLRRPLERIPLAASFDARRGRNPVKLTSRGCHEIVYGTTEIDLRGVEQLFDPSQTRAIAAAIHLAHRHWVDDERCLHEILDALERHLDRLGLDALDPYASHASAPVDTSDTSGPRFGRHPGAYARPRRFEVAAALNRMRSLRVRSIGA